jgi:hypothetical protein
MHLDLDAAVRELHREKNPPTITLGGQTFTCLPRPPSAAIAELTAAPEREDDPQGWLQAVISFIAGMLIDDDQDDWLDVAMDPERFPDPILDRTLIALAQEYVDRPSLPSTGSQSGPDPDGRTTSSTPSEPASATSVG